MSRTIVTINGKLLTDPQAATMVVALRTFQNQFQDVDTHSDTANPHSHDVYPARVVEILQLIKDPANSPSNRVTNHRLKLNQSEFHARNKSIHDAIENGASVESQVLKFNVSEATVSNAVRRHKLETARAAEVEANEVMIKALPILPSINSESDIPELDINVLNLSARSINALRTDDINTIGDLIERKDSSIMNIPNLGVASLTEIKNALTRINLSLR